MAKAILFDFWGTLAEQGAWSPVKQVRNILNIRMPFPEYVVRMQRAMMTTPFNELKDGFLKVGDEFNIKITPQQMDELVGMWNKSWMLAVPYDETITALTELKKKYQIVLACNTDQFSVEKVLDKFELRNLFDELFLSYKEGLLKTDDEFFSKVAQKLSLPLSECIMVGDSIQSDILPAQRAGIKAVLIDRKGKWDGPSIRSLNELAGFL